VDVEADERTANLIDERMKSLQEEYVGKLEKRHVRGAIQQFPEEACEVILLREWKEPSYQEMVTVLDCPVGTAMSRPGRARSKLRELLCALFEHSCPCPEGTEATE